jgi:hypothetical protein
MGATLDTRTLLTACRFSGAGLIALGLLLDVGGVEEVLLLCRVIGTATVLAGAVVLAVRLRGTRGAALLLGAVVAASGVLLVVSDGPHRLAWALVGGCCAGIAVAARTEPRVTPFADAATLDWMLRRILLIVVAGACGLALLAALVATGAPRAFVAPILLGATGLCIVGLVPIAMLLALPLRAIVATAPATSPARLSGVQPLADLVAAGLASAAVLLASARGRGGDRSARAGGTARRGEHDG